MPFLSRLAGNRSHKFVLCATLAGLLWLADARREAGESFAQSSAVAYAYPQSTKCEATRHET